MLLIIAYHNHTLALGFQFKCSRRLLPSSCDCISQWHVCDLGDFDLGDLEKRDLRVYTTVPDSIIRLIVDLRPTSRRGFILLFSLQEWSQYLVVVHYDE